MTHSRSRRKRHRYAASVEILAQTITDATKEVVGTEEGRMFAAVMAEAERRVDSRKTAWSVVADAALLGYDVGYDGRAGVNDLVAEKVTGNPMHAVKAITYAREDMQNGR